MTSVRIDKTTLRNITADVDGFLKTIESKYGVKFRQGTGHYGERADFKFEIHPVAVVDGKQTVVSPEAADFTRFAKQFGLEPEWLGKTFRTDKGEYRITGLKTRRHKYPVSAECVRSRSRRELGKIFKFPAQAVAGRMGGAGGIGKPAGLTEPLKEKFLNLATQLSPENLTCDGEASASEVRRRRTSLMRQWRALEAQVGRSVAESELW